MDMLDVYTMLPGVVVSYDGETVVARPAIPKKLANGDTLAAPQIVRVCVKWPIGDGGRAMVTVPLKPGDPIELTFSCRSLENWLSGSDTAPDDPRQFDLSDAFCTPLMRPGVGKADTENLSVQYGAGSMKISPDGVITFAGAQAVFNLPTIFNDLMTYTAGMVAGGGSGNTMQISGDVAIDGGSLTHNGKNIGSDHKHANSGGSGTGGEPI